MMLQNKTRNGFWQLADPKIWIASTVPMVMAAVLALTIHPARFSAFAFLLAIIPVYLIEIGKNALNEYVDYQSGVDPAVDAEHRTPFSGGKKTIVDGLLSPVQTLIIAGLTLAAAGTIGLGLIFLYHFEVLYFGLAGIGLAISYSLPPIKLAYRGLGELTVGLVFGPLLLNGMYWHLTGAWSFLPLLLSFPVGFLIANVLVINQFPDYEADLSGKKRNLVVRMGKKKAVRLYASLFFFTYFSIVLTTLVTAQPIWLIGLLSAPLAVRSVQHAARHHHQIQQLVYANATTIKIYVLNGLLLILATLIMAVLPI